MEARAAVRTLGLYFTITLAAAYSGTADCAQLGGTRSHSESRHAPIEAASGTRCDGPSVHLDMEWIPNKVRAAGAQVPVPEH